MVRKEIPMTRGASWAGAIVLVLTLGATAATADSPAAPELLPEATSLFVTIVDVPSACERFMNTAWGRMSQDPQIRPLIQQVYGSFVDAVAAARNRIGMTLPELLSIPQGEVAFAVVTPDGKLPVMVLILDAGKRLTSLEDFLRRVNDGLVKSGAKRNEETVDETKVVSYQNLGPNHRAVCYFIKDTTLVIGTDVEVVTQILATWNGQGGPTLDNNTRFTAVMQNCAGSQGEPQVAWYVDPVDLMRGMGYENTGIQVAVAVLPVLGLDGLAAVGGTMTLDTGDFDQVTQMHVLFEGAHAGVLKAIATDSGDAKPEPWVPDDISTYTTLYWKLETAYDAAAEVFDGFRGQGAFDDMVGGWFQQRTGLDLRAEVLPVLTGRLSYVQRIEKPVVAGSNSNLLAAELKKDAKADALLEKVFEHNHGSLERRTAPGMVYYEASTPQPSNPDPNRPPRPRLCFGIVDGYFVIADRTSFYQKVLETSNSRSGGLAAALDFKLLASKMQRQPGGSRPTLFRFERPEEGMQYLYEMALQDRTREGLARAGQRNLLFRSVGSALQQNQLPPFDVLKRYLAPGGSIVYEDVTGLHYTGFSLRRK